jgi:hypothetical protein
MMNLKKKNNSQETPEAKFVKELDHFDLLMQAREYELKGHRTHWARRVHPTALPASNHPGWADHIHSKKSPLPMGPTKNRVHGIMWNQRIENLSDDFMKTKQSFGPLLS